MNLFLYSLVLFIAIIPIYTTSCYGTHRDFNNSFESRNRTVFFEAFGNGVVYSVNYEARPWSHGKWRFGYRAGIGIAPNFITSIFNQNPSISVPVEFVAIMGKSNHFLSLGVGVSFLKIKPQDGFPHFINLIGIGYKYIPKKGSIFLKFQPMLAIPIAKNVFNFFMENIGFTVGIGIGYNFGSRKLNAGACD